MSFHLLVWRTSLIIIKPLIKHSISKKNGPKQCSTKYTVEWEVIKNYQYHLSPDEKKTYTESPFWYRPAMVSRLKAKCGVDIEASAPVPTSQVVGPWLSWAQEASKGDMHAICRGDGLFPRGKNGKKTFSNSRFLLLLKGNNIHQKGKKCSQPAQTNPIVGLPFFTNSKAYQEPSNGQQ